MTKGYVVYTQKASKSAQAAVYLAYSATCAQSLTEVNVLLPIAENTAKKLFVKVFAYSMQDIDSLPVNTTVTVRKNGVNTGLAVTINAAGTYVDTEDVAFADGDEISFSATTNPNYVSGTAVFAVGICFLLP